MIGKAQIISINNESARICASAARISTKPGDAMQIFSNSSDTIKNSKLIDKVLRSGHTSFIEHAVFTIAFTNVSVLVEQFFIEFRLASYTVKSRRYVDFGDMGFYTPDDFTDDIKIRYQTHMKFLFDEYNYLVSQDIPKEDARFILPYSFLSNFYCTVNARELTHMLNEIFGARGEKYNELQLLGEQICDQLNEEFPHILSYVKRNHTQNNDIKNYFPYISSKPSIVQSEVTKISCCDNSNISPLNSDIKQYDYIKYKSLELIQATFIIKNISLAGLTHIVRHRIQTIIVPPLYTIDPNCYIIPEKIANNHALAERYKNAYSQNIKSLLQLREQGIKEEIYFALSGNTINIISSMNARELKLFFNLRCCMRAQWEIRHIANNMLYLIRQENDNVFSKFGASCYANGKCPEGQFGCGKFGVS